MPRTDVAERQVHAAPERVFAAMADPEELVDWLPPAGMDGRFEHVDLRTGGSYRLVLTYRDASGSPGKATADSDVVDARIVEVVPGRRIVQAVDFVSEDPAFDGTMVMTWSVGPSGDGTLVRIVAEGVPDGITADDHAEGMSSSLEQLAMHVEW